MKRISLLLICLLLCITGYALAYEGCDYHVRRCDDNNICFWCGQEIGDAVNVERWIYHVEWDHVEFNETCCWGVCATCGEQSVDLQFHYYSCNDPESIAAQSCSRCGQSLADDPDAINRIRHIDDVYEVDTEDGSVLLCDHCGWSTEAHEHDFSYTWIDAFGCSVKCTICGYYTTWGHVGRCGDTGDDQTCLHCGGYMAYVEGHEEHPDNCRAFLDAGNDCRHLVTCTQCGDAWYENHTVSCDSYDFDTDRGVCVSCGAVNVQGELAHTERQLVSFDRERCYFSCACGQERDEYLHVVFCDSEHQDTCVECGRNTEEDRITISVTWHHDETFRNETECWAVCENCGELWRHTHFFNCDNGEQSNCDGCGAPADEVTIARIFHTGLENEMWWDEASCEDFHQPYCRNCDWRVGEAHPARYQYAYANVYQCAVTCELCDFAQDWGHAGQCGVEGRISACVRCGAENVFIDGHENHPEGAEAYVCLDENVHQRFCSFCGDDWGIEDHRGNCGSNDEDTTCTICYAEHVKVTWHDNHTDAPERAEYIDEYSHHAYCSVCGDDWGEIAHLLYCSDYDFGNGTGTCVSCGAENVSGRLEHPWSAISSDEYECLVGCACGQDWNHGPHGVSCTRLDEEVLTCGHCGTDLTISRYDVWHDYQHDHTYFDDTLNSEVHVRICRHCGDEEQHSFRSHYDPASYEEHAIVCDECGMGWHESHWGYCGGNDVDGSCVYCGDEHVQIGPHIDHLGLVYEPIDGNPDEHRVICTVCGNEWNQLHLLDCSDPSVCRECGAANVNGDVDHSVIIVGSTDEYCMVTCACGAIIDEGRHGANCLSVLSGRPFCERCGQEVSCELEPWHAFEHRHSRWNDAWGCEEHILGCRNCGFEEENGHPYIKTVFQNNQHDHYARCEECGITWFEEHTALCGGDDTFCYQCSAVVDMPLNAHDDHPEDAEVAVFIDEHNHRSFCRYCGDRWGDREHLVYCSDFDFENGTGTCAICGAENVYGHIEHNRNLIDFDAERCYFSCDCSEINDEIWHVIYCDSEDKNTCVACGKNTEADNITISETWHHNVTFHDENECWESCSNCGELYRGAHYFSCRDEEQQYCARCDASSNEVNIQTVRHDNIDLNDWGDGWHDPWCTECGEHLAEPHEQALYYESAGRDSCNVYCEVCGFLGNWRHQGQCGEPDDHTTCIRCGAVDVNVNDHSGHPEGSVVYEYLDEDLHRVYCGVCGDDWGSEYHRSLCGSDNSCIYCSADNVNISSHERHPDRSEVAEYFDEDSHTLRCGVCGDDLGIALHFADCDGSDRCAICGAEDVNLAYSDHVIHLVDFDTDYCYYGCSCGDYFYEVWHRVYCNSEDKNTCIECGKNVEADGIVIGDIGHDTECGADDKYCWTICPACGYMPYFGEHYTGCCSDDDTRCDNCGRTEDDDGISLVWKHTLLNCDEWDEDGTAMHRQVCRDCGYEGEPHVANADLIYTSIEGDPNSHLVSCSGCEFIWQESHIGECGNESNTCMYCGAENVQISMHENHPEDAFSYVCDGKDGHAMCCPVCGDNLGWQEHTANCVEPNRCFYCGADDVNISNIEHDVQVVDFDEEHCYYSCSCGDDSYSWQHVVYCDTDQSTCIGCGKNVEADGIVISIIWHRDEIGYNEDECWNTCTNCGDLYRGPHYFSCSDDGDMYCYFCGASAEEVNIREIHHGDIDFNDNGEGWHDPWCAYCGEHLGEPHEYSLYYIYGGYEQCRVYCETCGYLTNWGHQGQCGEPDEHTYCIRCGAEDIRVDNHGNHIGTDAFECIDENYHHVFCSVCGEEHYSEEHKSALGCDDSFGTCILCGAENVNLYGQLTYEERIEDGIRISINYNDDGSKHIDYSDAETGDYYGWEWYEHWDDEQPADWERRSDIVYDHENDLYSFSFDVSWGFGTQTRRISSDRTIYQAGFDGELFFEDILNEEECLWYCTHWDTEDHQHVLRTVVCLEDGGEWICSQDYEYDVRGIPGSVLVHTTENGVEVYQEFYNSADDEEPSQWERYSNFVYETEELELCGRVDLHRDFLTSEGDYGIVFFRIDNDNEWVYCYEDRTLGDGITRIVTVWDLEAENYLQTRWENDLPVHACRLTTDWNVISEKTWDYFASIGPVITEREWWDDGSTTYEKIYTNPDDEHTYEEHTFVDGDGYNWRAFTVKGVTRVVDQSILNLPEGIREIESEAFANVPGWIVVLPSGVTTIASDAFAPDTVILVPNEDIARLVQDAGYVWFFDR